jgi:DNA-binding LacI/PurR family transcriptional regulator
MGRFTIGLIGKFFGGQHFFAQGLSEGAGAGGEARPIFLNSGDPTDFLEICDAWVLLHDEGTVHLETLRESGAPIMGRAERLAELEVPVIGMDDRAAFFEVGRQCLRAGAEKLAFFGVDAPFSKRREEGTQRAAAEAGAEFLPFDDFAELEHWLIELRGEKKQAAVLCMNDAAGYRVLRVALHLYLEVPGLLQVVGVDNGPPRDGNIPTLSSIELPLREQGRMMGERLRALEAGEDVPAEVVNVPVDQVLVHHRMSTKG